MAEPDTAVIDRDTVTEEPSAPLLIEGTEPEATPDVAETEAGETTETVPPPPPSPWDGLTPDAIEEAVQAKLRDQEARLKESARQREENARREAEDRTRSESYNRRKTEAEQARGNYLLGQMAGFVNRAKETGEDPDWNAVRQVSEAVHHSALQTANDYWGGVIDDFLATSFPDWRPPRDVVREFQRARESYDYVGQAKATLAMVTAAAKEAARAELLPEVEKTVREKIDAEAKTKQLRAADATRAGTVRPTTPGAGSPGPSPDDVLSNPNATRQAKLAAYRAKYGFDP